MHHPHFPGWIMILLLITSLPAGNFQAGEALVCADPARLEIGAGQIRTLRILLVNANGTYGIDLQAKFDPAVVEVVDADPKKTGIQMTAGAFLKPDFIVRNEADNQAGMLRYVVTQLAPTPPATGKGTILLIQFQGKAIGKISALTITSVVIADHVGTKQAVTTQGSELVVIPPKPATPTVLPSPSQLPLTTRSPTNTPSRTKRTPTIQPSGTANRNIPPATGGVPAAQKKPAAQPAIVAALNNSAEVAERNPAASDRVFTAVSICGFSGAILFSALSVWLLVAKRRKEKDGQTK